MIRLLALSAVAVVAFDVVETFLYWRFIGSAGWILPMKFVVYAAFGSFLMRRGAGVARSMATIGCTALADVTIGWWLAVIVVFGPSAFDRRDSLTTPMPSPGASARGPGFAPQDPSLVVAHGPPVVEPLALNILVSIVRHSAAGAIGVALGSFPLVVRKP